MGKDNQHNDMGITKFTQYMDSVLRRMREFDEYAEKLQQDLQQDKQNTVENRIKDAFANMRNEKTHKMEG